MQRAAAILLAAVACSSAGRPGDVAASESQAAVEPPVPTHAPSMPRAVEAAPAPPANDRASRLVAEGNGRYATRELDAALESYRAALNANPGPDARAAAIRGIATTYSKLGDKRAALEWFVKYRALAPERERGKVDEIIRYYSASAR